LAACGPAGSGEGPSPGGAQGTAGPKRISAAIMGDPSALRNVVNTGGSTGGVAGGETIEELLHVGLGTLDNRGRLHPRLAEAIPSTENGHWIVHPDGRMETTWKLRPAARWHDGTPITAEDIVFTALVGSDPEVTTFRDPIYESIASVEAPDPRTVVVTWKRPYIDARAAFFSNTPASPLPKHLLASLYTDDRANLLQWAYWGPEFVGTGPFRLKEFARSSHLILAANDQFVLGRPKIDEIEVRFVADSNVLLANLMAGAVEMTLGRALSLDQALQIRDEWKEGRVDAVPYNWMAAYPQLLTPSPAIVGDARFRRALLHAVDRQQMVEGFQHGLGSVAHSITFPDEPEYRDVERAIVRYEYDPRKARAMIEELGYTSAADGGLRDAAGQRLAMEVRHITFDIDNKSGLFIIDAWQRSGVAAESVGITPQRSRDREWRATFPAFEVLGNPGNLKSLARLRLAQTPLPENGYTGTNRTRYVNPEFDALLETYFNTIPRSPRAEVVARIVHHMTDQVLWLSMFHRLDVSMIPHRVLHAGPKGEDATQAWNAHEWEIRGT
jgi:peptide/nickel transport system substrate-binding protein